MYFNSKIHPSTNTLSNSHSPAPTTHSLTGSLPMFVVRLRTLLKLYGGQRHPNIESFSALHKKGYITKFKDVPPNSTTIYVSHEWTSTNKADHDGTQTYHLLLALERLQNGEIKKTEMTSLHTLVYKQSFTTTAEDWTQMISSENTFIWYDWLCVPENKREDMIRLIPDFIERCDFTIVLVPGCSHLNKINSRTQRKMNLCFRTYRLRARCVLELCCSFLTTKGNELVRPMLLVCFSLSLSSFVTLCNIHTHTHTHTAQKRQGKTKMDLCVRFSTTCCWNINIYMLRDKSHAYKNVSTSCILLDTRRTHRKKSQFTFLSW